MKYKLNYMQFFGLLIAVAGYLLKYFVNPVLVFIIKLCVDYNGA